MSYNDRYYNIYKKREFICYIYIYSMCGMAGGENNKIYNLRITNSTMIVYIYNNCLIN